VSANSLEALSDVSCKQTVSLLRFTSCASIFGEQNPFSTSACLTSFPCPCAALLLCMQPLLVQAFGSKTDEAKGDIKSAGRSVKVCVLPSCLRQTVCDVVSKVVASASMLIDVLEVAATRHLLPCGRAAFCSATMFSACNVLVVSYETLILDSYVTAA
jgi:hypothetical protein